MTHSDNTFIDIHVLQTVPPSCINRDDTGSPKSAVYGGVKRARVSSQAWKRATRSVFRDSLDESELGERTLKLVDRIAKRIRDLDPDRDETASVQLANKVLSASGIKVKVEKKKTKDDSDENTAEEHKTGYLVFLSRAQIEALAELAANAPDGEFSKSEAQKALKGASSIDVALFGRMIADAPELNVDAACQVSHAISVHEVVSEFDYFTAVDDNAPEDNAGAGMIGTVEFNSSTLYRYATIDAVRLSENLGSKEAAVRAVDAFIRAFILSMPTGKQNTFANRTRPGFVMVQVRSDQPTNLVGAFEDPVRPDADGGVLSAAAVELLEFAEAGDKAYGTHPVIDAEMVADPRALKMLRSKGADSSIGLDELVSTAVEATRSRLVGE
ncbi:type I-E CRISPR-associated protein Cas7/Cse4/CasC [Actinomycetaceae bacterium MB13-C1-2]|nr:type I-E CRISPR-associated protein Cas7/Cse4/CasC [Actinomycetaceae bacterium MB13-C1-2]